MATTNTQFQKGVSASPETQFSKGFIPWNKDKIGVQPSTRKWKKLAPLSKEHKEKIKTAFPKKNKHWKSF